MLKHHRHHHNHHHHHHHHHRHHHQTCAQQSAKGVMVAAASNADEDEGQTHGVHGLAAEYKAGCVAFCGPLCSVTCLRTHHARVAVAGSSPKQLPSLLLSITTPVATARAGAEDTYAWCWCWCCCFCCKTLFQQFCFRVVRLRE